MRNLLGLLLLIGFAFVCISTSGADDFKPEAGFTMLLNGKNLDGWKLKGKKDGAELTGQTEASGGRFKVVEGVLVIDPKVKGDITMETVHEFAHDLTIKFDFKPGDGCNNDLFLRGTKFDIVMNAKTKGIKLGEWNEMEIVFKGEDADYKCNGESIGTRKVKTDKSPFGIRAEFGSIEIRKLRLKKEK
jgi:hypothetical protein